MSTPIHTEIQPPLTCSVGLLIRRPRTRELCLTAYITISTPILPREHIFKRERAPNKKTAFLWVSVNPHKHLNFLWAHTQQALASRWSKMLPTKAKFYLWWHHQLTWVRCDRVMCLSGWFVRLKCVWEKETKARRQTERWLQHSALRNPLQPSTKLPNLPTDLRLLPPLPRHPAIL